MPIPEPQKDKYSYTDYLSWPEEENWEIIEGVPYDMKPAPSPRHQEVALNLVRIIADFLDTRPCRIYIAPFDVRLSRENARDDEVETVVQPDLTVICDEKKIDTRGCKGSPDLVVEILSPATSYKDETEKLKIYEKYKVREYWIINPDVQWVMVYTHNGKKFEKPAYFASDETFESGILQGLKLELHRIF